MRQPPLQQQQPKRISYPFYFKVGAVFVLVLLSVLVVACGGAVENTAGFGPAPTVTFQINNDDGTPGQQGQRFQCGAWATQATANIKTTRQIGIYAKFVEKVNGNPRGIGGASAIATVHWGDGSTNTLTEKTTDDGLAVFALTLDGHDGALNMTSIVTVEFNKPGVGACSVTQNSPAFFTLIAATPSSSPTTTATVTKTPKPTKTPRHGGN